MISKSTIKLFSKLCSNHFFYKSHRNAQVSVIGAANELGTNLALLLKRNTKITSLKLYDENEMVMGIAEDLSHLPEGPEVVGYAGNLELGDSIKSSDIIAVVTKSPFASGVPREQIIYCNAPLIYTVCRTMALHNPEAFLAISIDPLNSIIPYATSLLSKYNCVNPTKIFGITNIDIVRSRTFAANALQVDPEHLDVPVIGGQSDQTIIPLFSNLTPSEHQLDNNQVDLLTRLVRRASVEIVVNKHGTEAATLAVAWSIQEFIDGLIDATNGKEVILNSYTANPHFGTRFFSGPTKVGPTGIMETFFDLPMSDYECKLLNSAIPYINQDIAIGESLLNR